jgi:predicted nucleotidyltransferase
MTLSPAAQAALDEVLEREDPNILGIVLSGSAARAGMATEHSDVDVFVVRTDEAAEGRTTSRSRYIDEIPQTLAGLEDVPLWGGDEYGYRWGYCYAQVLRDGRRLDSRLDAAESVHWWLDVVFTLEGRVRPYNKYLAWELRAHPLTVPEWSAERLLPQVEVVLDGDADAVRAAYLVVERECRAWDERHGGHDLHELIESWGDELALLRGS